MKKRVIQFSAIALAILGLSVYLQADFVQCAGGVCSGTTNADVINGSDFPDTITGLDEADVIFAGSGMDSVDGGPGDDLLSGDLDSDSIMGMAGDDIILPGPDEPNFSQFAMGGDGNDQFNTLVGETTECLLINGEAGADVANLVGYGPYTGISPFGQSGFGTGYVWEVDPVGGGDVLIFVAENGDLGTEVINGLLSPNVVILPTDDPIVTSCMSYLSSSPSVSPSPAPSVF